MGKNSNAQPERPLKDDIARIRVIGREEITNSETAQYHLLLSSLTDARPASGTSSFVTAIWFPKKAQSIERHDEETQSLSDHASQILANLNGSQREIVVAMLSPAPQDSLVIAHGIIISF
jgi:regulator of nonsense transcripts 1